MSLYSPPLISARHSLHRRPYLLPFPASQYLPHLTLSDPQVEAACRRFRCYECQRLRLDHAAAAAHAALAVATIILAARRLRDGGSGGGSDGWDAGSSWDMLKGAAGGTLLQPAAAAQQLLQGLPAACLLLALALVPALVLPAVLLERIGPQAGARCVCGWALLVCACTTQAMRVLLRPNHGLATLLRLGCFMRVTCVTAACATRAVAQQVSYILPRGAAGGRPS